MTTPAEQEFDLDVEPDPPIVGDVLPPEPEAVAARGLATIFPADFPLMTLLRFVPDVALKRAVERAAEHALRIDVTLSHGLTDADDAVVDVKRALAAVDAPFEDPVGLANQLHKRLTGLRADFKAAGVAAVETVARRIIDERRRREAVAAEQDRLRQAEADAIAKRDAELAAKEAAARGAPKAIVKDLKAAARAATAPPVATSAPPRLGRSTVVEKFKARLRGTPPGGEPNPAMNQLSLAQQQQVRRLMLAVAEGKAPLTVFEIDWAYLNGRAVSDKTTLDIPEIEAFDEGGLRSKPARGRR